MPRILVVCTGNLCRSPMAAALLQARLARDEKRRDWQVSSAGIWAVEGLPPSDSAVEEMARRELDISGHRASPITRAQVARSELVLVMTRNHAEALKHAFPELAGKIHLLSEMVGQQHDIRDPYGGVPEEYASAARELERLVEGGYGRIVALVEGKAAE